MAERRIGVFLCDDSSGFRQLVGLQLEQDGRFEVVGQAGEFQGCAESVAASSPDILLLDHGVSDEAGWSGFVGELRAAAPDAAIVLFSGLPADVLASEAQAHGLDGYFPKDDSVTRLCDVLVDVAARRA